MTDQPQPTADELLTAEAKLIVSVPAEPIPSAQGLPDDVRDGHIEDDPDVQEQGVTTDKEV